MAKVSKAMRERLLRQRQEMYDDREGRKIDTRNVKKLRFRIVPRGKDEEPGLQVISYYCERMGKGKRFFTSPATFGKADPIATALKQLSRGSSRDKKKAESVTTITNYWLPCVVRGEETDDDGKPVVRAFPAPARVYAAVLSAMGIDAGGDADDEPDEDEAVDVTDPTEGCDILVKSPKVTNDKWETKVKGESPLHEDDEVAQAILDAAAEIDWLEEVEAVNYDAMEDLYEYLTDEPMPSKYRDDEDEDKPKKSKKKSKKTDDDDDDDDDEEEDKPKKKSKKKSKAVAKDDDDDDDDDDEDDSDSDSDSDDDDDDDSDSDDDDDDEDDSDSDSDDDDDDDSDSDDDDDDEEDKPKKKSKKADAKSEDDDDSEDPRAAFPTGTSVVFDLDGAEQPGIVHGPADDSPTGVMVYAPDEDPLQDGCWDVDVSALRAVKAKKEAKKESKKKPRKPAGGTATSKAISDRLKRKKK